MGEAQSQKISKQIRKRKSRDYSNECCIDYDSLQGYKSKGAFSYEEMSRGKPVNKMTSWDKVLWEKLQNGWNPIQIIQTN